MSRPKKGEPGYAEFREREKARNARYRNSPEGRAKRAAWRKAYAATHGDELRESVLRWQKAHPERMREYIRRFHEKNPGYWQRPEVKARKAEYARRPEVKARKAEYARRPEVKARKAEYARRYWAKIVDSYDLHDRKCERVAMWRRRRKIVNQATPYTPRRGLRVPPSWMRRPCDLYAPGGRGAAGEAFARELFRERREWMHRHNRA